MLEHGGRLGPVAERYGISRQDWLDLSTGIAPWHPELPMLSIECWTRLPEEDDDLAEIAAEYYGRSSILAVPGIQSAIQRLPGMKAQGNVLVISPCYAEHAHAWRQKGHEVHETAWPQEQALSRADVAIVVNPNNPTGRCLPPELLLQWHAVLQRRGGWLIVDESFVDAQPSLSIGGIERPGLIVLRSFGKFFGLAGIRLGFVLAEKTILSALRERLGPWAVNGPARAIASRMLGDRNWQAQQRSRLWQASERLRSLLDRYGWTPDSGSAHFQWLVRENAASLHERLCRCGILTRRFDHLSGLRIGLPGNETDWRRLEKALQNE